MTGYPPYSGRTYDDYRAWLRQVIEFWERIGHPLPPLHVYRPGYRGPKP